MTAEAVRVLVTTPDYPPDRGGIQTLMYEVVRRLERTTPAVVTFAAEGATELDARDGTPTVRVRYDAAHHRASVLHLNGRCVLFGLKWRPHAILSGHVVMAPATMTLRRALRIPVVQYTHANEFEGQAAISRQGVRRADAVVAVSRYTAGLAQEAGARAERVHIIPPGVAPRAFPSRPRDPRPTLLTIARMQELNKGHDVILRALPKVLEQVPDVRWVVLGDGPLRSGIERLADEAGVREAVDFRGSVSDEERDGWLDRAHVFVLPSRPRPSGGGGEGFGIVYLEAASHGLPVVAGAVGGALDAVADGHTGLLVDPGDANAVADALLELLLDPERAREFGRAGVARAGEFTWEATASRVQDLLLSAAGR